MPRKKSEPRNSADDAYQFILDAILTGVHPPGSYVSESDILEKTPFKRTAVRDAFARLASENLVMIRPQRATIVCELGIAEIADLMGIRFALESLFAWRLARNPYGTLTETRKIHDKMCELVERVGTTGQVSREDRRKWMKMDIDFHSSIALESGHRVGAEMLSVMRHRLALLAYPSIVPENMRVTRDEHQDILAAIRPPGNKTPKEADVREKVRVHMASALGRWQVGGIIQKALPELFPDEGR